MTTLNHTANLDEITLKPESMNFFYQYDDEELDDFFPPLEGNLKSDRRKEPTFADLEQYHFVGQNSGSTSNTEPGCSDKASEKRKRSHTKQEKSRKKKAAPRKRDKADGNQKERNSKGVDGGRGRRRGRRDTSPPITRLQSKPALRMRIKLANKRMGVIEKARK